MKKGKEERKLVKRLLKEGHSREELREMVIRGYFDFNHDEEFLILSYLEPKKKNILDAILPSLSFGLLSSIIIYAGFHGLEERFDIKGYEISIYSDRTEMKPSYGTFNRDIFVDVGNDGVLDFKRPHGSVSEMVEVTGEEQGLYNKLINDRKWRRKLKEH